MMNTLYMANDNRMIERHFVQSTKRFNLFMMKCWRFLKKTFNRG